MNTKNRFAAAAANDSDDEVAQHKTKTAIKKEERKITEKKPKVNVQAAAAEGFEVVQKEGERGGEPRRGGRGAARPDTAKQGRGGRGGARAVREDADGNKIGGGSNAEKRRPFTGKPREDAHPMDRQSGMGRGTRKPHFKKGGAGKGNIGVAGDVQYKKKGEEGEEEAKGETKETKEEPKEEKKEEPKVIIKEEVIGISIDDFFANRTVKGPAQARAAEVVQKKDLKLNDQQKEAQVTQQASGYQKNAYAKTTDAQVA